MRNHPKRPIKWDYIIIGAGSAGCALAYELVTGRPAATVLLLEAGGSDRSPFIRFPAGAIRAVEKYDWGFHSQPDPTCNGATEAWIRGRVLGGSSSINTTVYVRGAARDFDRWEGGVGADIGTSWSSKKIMPLFRDMECSDQNGQLRGKSGPLYVRTVNQPHALTTAFIESAVTCGHKFNADYNGESQAGIGYAQVSQKKGLRCSSADAFVRPLLGEGNNFELLLNAFVRKIHFNNRRAAAVSYVHRGKQKTEAGADIIVCAGAVGSPQLLMLSGVGDPRELERHNIDVITDLPGVGRNLQEHPSLRLLYKSTIPSYNLTGGFRQKLQIVRKFLTTREGPISNIFEGVGFLKSSPTELVEDIQLHFAPIGYFDTRDYFAIASFPSMSIAINKSYPLGRGRIRLANEDPRSAPLIECRLLGADADVDTLARGLEVVREIMRAKPIARFVAEEVVAGSNIAGASAIKEFIRNNAKIIYHPVGTCRMGTGIEAVVGADLQVRGVENLWVADASIIPDLISGNTNAACMMIGKKLGKQLIAQG